MRRVGNTSKGTERMAIIRGKEIFLKKVWLQNDCPLLWNNGLTLR